MTPLLLVPLLLASAAARDLPEGLPEIRYHLTARPWRSLSIPAEQYLDVIEGICRFSVRHQDQRGAIIDPFLKREHQYATPYFAYAVGTLLSAGRAAGLLEPGVRAMEHATQCFAGGREAIPDQHGEFFIPVLTAALELYEKHIPKDRWRVWRDRLKKPRPQVLRGGVNNWETYAMKGEWLRARAGLVDRLDAVAFIEDAWNRRQGQRIAASPWHLYHDRTSDPDTLNVEAVGRGNLLALIHLGYDGPSSAAIRREVEAGSRTALLLQDPSGQAPTNGRTDNHVWVDVGYQLAFEVMAERAHRQGDGRLAGQYRRAALLAFRSIARWRRDDPPWDGSYFVTKNHFDPALRVGYQNASQYSNYNGSLMFHLAEAFRARKTDFAEQPAPVEIGGYAFATEREFASVFANAGGMQMQANLRGQLAETHGNRWTPLGAVRFGRVEFDTRLGPSDGALARDGGVSFAPAFFENGRWLRLADLSDRYQGSWDVAFAHPVLVRCAIDYRPVPGQSGPAFRHEFILTPDGILSTLRKTTTDDLPWGVTWPLLVHDGAPLLLRLTSRTASVSYANNADEQTYIALDPGSRLEANQPLIRATYGDLRPLLVTVPARANRTFIDPRGAGDPAPEAVRQSFRFTANGFQSVLGRVTGNLYTGRTAAGGHGAAIDITGDGKADVTFRTPCGFLLQLRDGRVTALEADRDVRANLQGRRLTLAAYTPVALTAPARYRRSSIGAGSPPRGTPSAAAETDSTR